MGNIQSDGPFESANPHVLIAEKIKGMILEGEFK